MPDFAMCENKECSLADSCWRFNASPDRLSQVYENFQQDDDGVCEHYMEVFEDGMFNVEIDE
jgi:hypothetical protein